MSESSTSSRIRGRFPFAFSTFALRASNIGIGDLSFDELGIVSIIPYELLVPTLFENLAIFKHHNSITMPDCTQPVGDDKTCPVLQQLKYSLLNQGFAGFIHIGCRFIQEQD